MFQRDDSTYSLRYGHSQAAINYRKALALREFSRETQAMWQSRIPAATTLLDPAKDIELWPQAPDIKHGFYTWAQWKGLA